MAAASPKQAERLKHNAAALTPEAFHAYVNPETETYVYAVSPESEILNCLSSDLRSFSGKSQRTA